MDSEEGVGLLLRGHESQDIRDNFDTALKIVHRLGGLALAIDQAAAYIGYRRIALDALDEFLTEYDLQRKRILSYTPAPFWEYCKVPIHLGEDRDQAINAFTTWEMSLEQLNNDKSIDMNKVTRFLSVSAFFNPTGVEEWLFRNRWETDQTQWLGDLGATDNGANHENCSDMSNERTRDARSGSDRYGKNYEMTSTKLERKLNRPLSPHLKLKGKRRSKNHSRDGDGNRPSTHSLDRKWDSMHFLDIIDKLHRLSLVQDVKRIGQGAFFSLHPLIQDWLQLREQAKSRRVHIRESLEIVACSARLYCEPHPTGLDRRIALLAHIDACLSNDERLSEPQYQIGNEIESCGGADELVEFYCQFSRFEAATILNSRSLKTREEIFGEKHPDTLWTAHNQAAILMSRFKYHECEEMLRQTMQLAENGLGKEHPFTLTSRTFLAVMLGAQGKYDKAEPIIRQTLQLQEKALGKEHLDTILSMSNLASILVMQKNNDEAEKLFHQALQSIQKTMGTEHRDTLNIMDHSSKILLAQDKYNKTEMLFRQTLTLRQKVLGREHEDTLGTMIMLASVLKNQRKYDEAEVIFRQTLTMRQKVLGREHEDTLKSMKRLAMILKTQGKHDEADEMDRGRLELENARRTKTQDA
ncbi:MAG: hypothetical protein Q9191_005959 [Dirinaria sp. TL-2023a]